MSNRGLSWGACLLLACVASESGSDSQISSPRIIAVIATPPEVMPGGKVHLRAVIASSNSTATPTVSWSFCRTPSAASDNTAASVACVEQAEQPIAGNQSELDTVVPSDACKLFGSEAPAGTAPNRADVTGGYYQPVRVALDDTQVAVLRLRIRCALPSAPLAAARTYTEDYVFNQAPRIASIELFADDVEVEPTAIPENAALRVRIQFAKEASESYLYYEPHSGVLETKQEVLSTTWFTSAGRFFEAVLPAAEATIDNALVVGSGTTSASLWVVVRDDRGGSSVVMLALQWLGSR